MSDNIESGPPNPLDSSLAKAGFAKEDAQPAGPVYQVVGDSKIAVSSQRGKLWKSRKGACQKGMKDLEDAWNEAIRYYNHDQSAHRDNTDPDHSGSRFIAKRINDRFSSTENIVYCNVNAQLPELYSKNPTIEVSAGSSSDEEAWEKSSDFARAVEKLVNVLFGLKTAPGVSLKNKAKRAVVVALLTNRVWFETGYVLKEGSSDNALNDLARLSQELVKAKDVTEIKRIEGALQALEEKIEFLQPSGPTLHIRMPHQVLVDPDHNDPWLSDANWLMIEDMMPTEYINAVFGKEDEEKEETKSIYEPTHILDGGSDDDTESFSLFDSKKDYNAYGFDNSDSFNKAKRTRVWRVWDKTTRRLELYSDKDWSWPIWVWDDPYKLDGFFPLSPLWFHENPIGVYGKGEVSYYLDQQDQINAINDERNRSLGWARRNLFYDKNRVDKDDVEKILKGPDATITGLDVPEGMDPSKLIFSITPPSINFTQLFDKQDLYAAVDRIAATNEMMRGQQFKTNTTNRAIDYYSTLGNMRMDERLDSIEDTIGDVGWKVAQLCLRFMPPDVVSSIIGMQVDETNWRPLDTLADRQLYSFTVTGGSTQKMSSAALKQEAVQVGQILSQFARAAPASVLKTTLRMFEHAFDDVIIREEDWDAIAQEAATVVAQGSPAPPGASPGGGPSAVGPNSGVHPPTDVQSGSGNPLDGIMQVMESMPPQMLKAIGLMLAKGVPPQAILQQLTQSPGAPMQ
jgi:hypothetical protein